MRTVDLTTTFIYVVNEDLNMSKGKISAQVSHVAMLLADKNTGILGRAIILKAPEKTLRFILENYIGVERIEDAGLTEVSKGSLTCIGFLRDEIVAKETTALKLL